MRSPETLELWQRALAAATTELAAGHDDARQSIQRLARSIADATRGDVGLETLHQAADALGGVEGMVASEVDRLRELITEEAVKVQQWSPVLIVDDDAITRRLLERALAPTGRRVIQAASASEAMAWMERERFSLIVLDLVLPDADGRTVLMKIRTSPRAGGTPVFVLSGQVGAMPRTECLALGADGFFEKPFDPQAISLELSAALLQAEVRRRHAMRDPLTQLPNRAGLADLYAEITALMARSNEPFAVAMIDLDDLKGINDTLGHPTGDAAIRRFAAVFRETLRSSDVVARWGGDEFVAIFPRSTAPHAAEVLGRCRTNLAAAVIEGPGGRRRTMTFSGGVIDADLKMSLDDAVAEADRRAYAAKQAGRDRTVFGEVPELEQKPRVLLAEDDAVTAAIVKHRLGQAGLNVVHFSDGQQAWESMQAAPPSLAILDIQMPGIEGIELLRLVRQHPRLGKLPVIILTAMGNEDDVIRAFDAGASDYVPKPFSPAELGKRVLRLLKKL